LFYEATGLGRDEWLAIDHRHPRFEEFCDLRRKIGDENPDGDPVDEHGASVSWNEISDELWPLSETILDQTPRSLVDLAWQAEALFVADAELQESNDFTLCRVRKLFENIRTLSGPLSIPNVVCLPTTSDPIYAAIEHHRSAVENFKKSMEGEDADIVDTDDSRYIEAQKRIQQASDAMDDAAEAILALEPQTPRAAAAALRYMVGHIDRYDGETMGWPHRLLPDGVDPDTAKWNAGRSAEYFLMQNVAATLERLSVA
jgi:hypothetical protein